MQDIYDAASLLTTQRYGPLYVVSGSHARGRTFHVYQLDDGQELRPLVRPVGPNNKHPDVRENQEVFGVVSGQRGWTEEYGWLQEHPNVKDGTAQALLQQLIEANKTAIDLGMNDFNARQVWLQGWARENLGKTPVDIALPDLNTASPETTL